jgi:hypothetical protein
VHNCERIWSKPDSSSSAMLLAFLQPDDITPDPGTILGWALKFV